MGTFSRRKYLAAGLAAAVAVGSLTPAVASTGARGDAAPAGLFEHATVVDLQTAMHARLLSSEQATRGYLHRIDQLNPILNAVVRVNPDAVTMARRSDAHRRAHGARGPLEGIPVLLKENMNTADRQATTAGSKALLAAKPAEDAFLVARLRAAGAVILGKANLSEWSNFRGSNLPDGWSAIGGQTHNPYVLDRSPSGSSSGSAASAAAGLAAVAIGTDTDGSVVYPASATSTVGIRPTLGLVSRGGIVPITSRHDTPGPIARTVTDAALTLWAIQGVDPADPATAAAAGALPSDPRAVLNRDALRGKRIGLWRAGHTGVDADVDRVFDGAVRRLRDMGATVVEGADVPDIQDVTTAHTLPAVLTEFKHDLNAYLAATPGRHPKDLRELIEYHERHPDGFDHLLFDMADKTDGDLTAPAYRAHREAATGAARRAIDDLLGRHRLDAIVTPTSLPAPVIGHERDSAPFAKSTTHSTTGGYPHITVPAGYSANGLPLGLSFIGTRFSDARLLGFAYAFEQATNARRTPRYLPTTR
ncbi:amidase family protein [Kibdelosporangium phytohabitans]|uniref:Amidase n=1 Tax=Kibdelosporangium phytohabitans TaxID=860235 RepID=A0A0N9I2Z0_9PSEU|nr:amidase family protein [Kibdelosporangium phytohabitans]ALG10406.1 amidase [Kibdelosporangium phytohabitans]MBE1461468.1 amidase [Kibdelosporangium phytohabitans]